MCTLFYTNIDFQLVTACKNLYTSVIKQNSFSNFIEAVYNLYTDVYNL